MELQHHNLKFKNKELIEELRPKYIKMIEGNMVQELNIINQQQRSDPYLPKLDTRTDSTI